MLHPIRIMVMKLFCSVLLLVSISGFSQEKQITVNGHTVHVFTKGLENRKAKTPVIVFENGMGMGLDNWNPIIDELAKVVPVVSYDRAGIGKSEIVYRMPTPRTVSENLKAILTTMKVAPPYLLVGHSMGGLYSRAYAGYYPTEIAGLVLIDPADFTESKEDWNSIFRKLEVPEKKIDEMLYDRLYKETPPTHTDSLYFGIWSELQVLRALRRTDFQEITDLPLPDVPIYFFIGGKFEVPPENRSKDYDHEKFFEVRTNINIERWKKFIYSSSKGGALIYLSKSGHFVHRDDAKHVTGNIKILIDELIK